MTRLSKHLTIITLKIAGFHSLIKMHRLADWMKKQSSGEPRMELAPADCRWDPALWCATLASSVPVDSEPLGHLPISGSLCILFSFNMELQRCRQTDKHGEANGLGEKASLGE